MDPALLEEQLIYFHHGTQLNEPINIYINSYKNNNMSFAFNENWCTKIKNMLSTDFASSSVTENRFVKKIS